jgi:hypothetical protein
VTDDPISLLFVTLAIKAIAYFFVIRLGILRLVGPVGRVNGRAIALVAARLLLGLLFAVPLWLLSSGLSAGLGEARSADYLGYFVVYAPLRWIAWSVVALWIIPKPHWFIGFLLGFSSRDRVWRLSAVGVSFACDAPLLVGYGGPVVGKFFC